MAGQPPAIPTHLDDRERSIIEALITEGSTRGVAEALHLSERHTRRLLHRLQRRLGVTNTHAVVALAVEADLTGSEDSTFFSRDSRDAPPLPDT